MGKKVKIGMVVFILIFASVLVSTTFADSSSDPGSINDPIVTKSYVDEQISKIALDGGGQASAIVTEKLNAGDVLVAGSGTEVILRTGTAVAYGDGSNGIPDVTGGVDIKIGSNIPLNHQLIFPKADGRGIKITTGPAYVMVRGEYQIISGK